MDRRTAVDKKSFGEVCESVRRRASASVADPAVYALVNALAERWPAPEDVQYVLALVGLDRAQYNLECDPRAVWARIFEDAHGRAVEGVLLDVVVREWVLPGRVYPRG